MSTTRKKCSPQKYPDQGRCICQCLRKIDPQRLFRENSRDVANTLVDVMQICGIHECKAKAAREVIINAFTHYDEVRHRVDVEPKKSLRKENLMHDLGCKCLMTRIEAQLTYTIMKRAFKAFYYGTSDFGIRNPIIEAQLIHSQQCLWVHAAKRTAQIYAEYEGMFFPTQKKFEQRIKCAYARLYERMAKRANPIKITECCCQKCIKRIVPTAATATEETVSTGIDELSVEINPTMKTADRKVEIAKRKTAHNIALKQNLEKLPRCTQCKCPRLICDCLVDPESGILNYECSQGPFKVRWLRVDNEPQPDPCFERPGEHVCPVDCDELSQLSLAAEDVCTCSDGVCECEDEMSDEEDILEDVEAAKAEEAVEDEKSIEISDTRTVYSCHMPEVDYTPIMLKDKSMCEKETVRSIEKALKRPVSPCKSATESRQQIASKKSSEFKATEAVANSISKEAENTMVAKSETKQSKVADLKASIKLSIIERKSAGSDVGYFSDLASAGDGLVKNSNKQQPPPRKMKDEEQEIEIVRILREKLEALTKVQIKSPPKIAPQQQMESKLSTNPIVSKTNNKQTQLIKVVNNKSGGKQPKKSALKTPKSKVLKSTFTIEKKKHRVSFLEKSIIESGTGCDKTIFYSKLKANIN